jgi:hypothetical protein
MDSIVCNDIKSLDFAKNLYRRAITEASRADVLHKPLIDKAYESTQNLLLRLFRARNMNRRFEGCPILLGRLYFYMRYRVGGRVAPKFLR